MMHFSKTFPREFYAVMSTFSLRGELSFGFGGDPTLNWPDAYDQFESQARDGQPTAVMHVTMNDVTGSFDAVNVTDEFEAEYQRQNPEVA